MDIVWIVVSGMISFFALVYAAAIMISPSKNNSSDDVVPMRIALAALFFSWLWPVWIVVGMSYLLYKAFKIALGQ